MAEVEQKKKRTFCKFTYCGVDLDQLLDVSYEQLMAIVQRLAEMAPELRPAEGAALTAQTLEEGQEGGATHGEARGGEDPP